MKMSMGVFWGVVITLIGIGILVNVVFKVNLPIFKILIGLFFIYLGLQIIFGWRCCGGNWGSKSDVVFHQQTISNVAGNGEYNAVFGKVNVDLRNLQLTEKVTRLEVNAVFGGAEIWLRPNMPFKINADAAFGGVQMPANSAGGFGSTTYTSPNFDESQNYLLLKVAAVFGGVVVYVE